MPAFHLLHEGEEIPFLSVVLLGRFEKAKSVRACYSIGEKRVLFNKDCVDYAVLARPALYAGTPDLGPNYRTPGE